MVDPEPAPMEILIMKVFESDDPFALGSTRMWMRTHPLPEGWRELRPDGTVRY